MTPELAGLIWTVIGAYAAIGAVVSLLFVTVLIKRASAGARTAAPLQFRVLIFPACIILWPYILMRSLIRSRQGGDHETTA